MVSTQVLSRVTTHTHTIKSDWSMITADLMISSGLTPLQRSELEVLQDQLVEDPFHTGLSMPLQRWVDVVKGNSTESLT